MKNSNKQGDVFFLLGLVLAWYGWSVLRVVAAVGVLPGIGG